MSLKDFSSNSRYDTDKVVFADSGSVSIASLPAEYDSGFGYVIKRLAIPHGMPRPVLPEFRFSLDGGTSWEIGGSGTDSIAYCTDTDIVLLIQDGVTGTYTYEVFGIWINEYDDTNPLVESVTVDSNTYFDSRKNYRKIIDQDTLTISPSDTVYHGLEYFPAYSVYFESRPGEIWQEHAGGIRNPWNFDFSMAQCISHIGTNLLTIDCGAGTVTVWYRIYADG